MHENNGPNIRGDSPAAAASEFRSLLASGGSLQGIGGTDPDFLGQLRGLERWAEERGELGGGHWLTSSVLGGAEHFIQHSEGASRVIKITRPGQFGQRMRLTLPTGKMPRQLSEALALRPSTPLEYLDRLELHNRLFGRSLEFLGLVRWKGSLSFVTSQIFLRGEKPDVADIKAVMAGYGFRKLGDENAYFREADSLAVFDAHTRNYVLTEGIAVPFDVIPQIVTGRFKALLSLW